MGKVMLIDVSLARNQWCIAVGAHKSPSTTVNLFNTHQRECTRVILADLWDQSILQEDLVCHVSDR